ncbi:MAG: DUF2892 domain-containing protein [Halanaerobium sp.]
MDSRSFVFLIEGLAVLLGFLGGWFIHEYFYILNLFVGINLTQCSITGCCPPEKFYNKFLNEYFN